MWRYEAIDLREPGNPVRRTGEIAGETAADARASLRAVGLQVLAIAPDRASRRTRVSRAAGASMLLRALRPGPRATATVADPARGYSLVQSLLRGRRVQERADAFDALATLLESGIPLSEAVATLAEAGEGQSRPLRRVLLAVREDLGAGKPLSVALARHGGWFDAAEVAMVDAAEVAGTLAPTLAEVARRQARSAAVMQKLVGALAYPAVIAVIGAAVAMFLATQTLPQLVAILDGAKIKVPALTAALVALGAAAKAWWPFMAGAILLALVALALGLPRAVARLGPQARGRLDRMVPLAVRRMALARSLLRIADLLRAGVPLVESLRTVGNGCSGLTAGLGAALLGAARRLEEGDDFAAALAGSSQPPHAPGPRIATPPTSGGAWFDAECVRLVAVGEAGGDLAPVLQRLGERYERQTARLVDRMAALLEPAAVIVLAALVGTVVMAAVLPLLKLQEIL